VEGKNIMAKTTIKAKAEKTISLKIFKTDPRNDLPKFATEQSACFDLAAQFYGKEIYQGYNANNVLFDRKFTNNSIKLMPGDRMIVPTGLIFDIPEGYSLRIHARSGLSLKQGLVLVNSEAVIDSDFVHETSVLLVNTSNNPISIRHGDRIAQAELVPVLSYDFVEIKKAPKDKTSRKGGLGSTGIETKEEPKEVEEKKEEPVAASA
jgi:dUTP pyrophosphatase